MNTFLEQVLAFAQEKMNQDLSKACFVFPNRRSGVFFKKVLATKTDRPVWAPGILSIQDWINEHTPYTYPQKLELTLELFRMAGNRVASGSFEQYLPWGEMIINDFDEIDKYLLQADEFFAYLKNYKELEHLFSDEEELEAARKFTQTLWGKSPDEDAIRKKFIEWWEQIGTVYTEFKNKLISNQIAYEGMGYRYLAENPEKLLENDTVYFFAGFHALSPSEFKIIQFLRENEKCFFLIDADRYYMDEPMHDAGYFLRKLIKQLPPDNLIGEHLHNPDRKLHTYAATMRVAQAKTLGQNLKKNPVKNYTQQKLPDTAIVLADESLLPVVLSSLPKEAGSPNITMGYPLAQSLISNLMELVFVYRAHPLAEQNRDVLPVGLVYKILTHPLVYNAFTKTQKIAIQKNLDVEKIQIYRDAIKKIELPEELHNILLKDYSEIPVLQFAREMLDPLIDFIINIHDGQIDQIEYQSMLYFRQKVNRLSELVDQYQVDIQVSTFWKLLKKIVTMVKVPFQGEPLQGIQLMGFLETRCLDFKYLHILSVNEGFMPPTGDKRSFIPYQIRKAFKLPVAEEQEAIAAYHFYRLLQRAEQVDFYYNAEPGEGGKEGEMSRFIHQMELLAQLDKKKQIGNITHFKQDFVFKKEVMHGRNIQKSTTLNKYLYEKYLLGKKAFYPTQLASYLIDPVAFYFKIILGVQERDRLEELDARLFGIAFHEVMDAIYRDIQKTTLTEDILQAKKKVVRNTLKNHFLKQHGIVSFTGSNRLNFDIIENLVNRMIDFDIEHLPFRIDSIEAFDVLKIAVPLEVNGRNFHIHLNGRADRIEYKDDQYVVVDYKTGADRISPVDFSKEDDPAAFVENLIERIDSKKAVFQTLMYAWLLHKKMPYENVNAGIVSMRDINKGVQLLSKDSIPVDVFAAFELKLKEILSGIFDPDLPFEADFSNRDANKLNSFIRED